MKVIKVIDHLLEIPGKLGITVIRDLFLPATNKNEFKLRLRGYCQADPYSCGIAAGWSVLKAFNPRARLKQFAKDCAPDKKWGVPTRRLAFALRNQGCRVQYSKLDFKTIQAELQQGRPILTAIHRKDDEWHWIVIYGFGVKPSRIFFIGNVIPGFSRAQMLWHDFKKQSDLTDSSLLVSFRQSEGPYAGSGRDPCAG